MPKDPALPSAQTNQPLDVLILAAGLGTRMKSSRAKVLHEIGGLPLINYVSRTAKSLNPRKVYVIVGHQADEVSKTVAAEIGDLAEFVVQTQQRGTGDAVRSAKEQLADANSVVVILSGDVPLLKPETLMSFINSHREQSAACSILSVRLENSTGYGRIVRGGDDKFSRIVEKMDASPY